jgi:hypothetical protein
VPGQLEHRPVGLGLVEGSQVSRRLPLLVAEVAEGLLHPAELDLEGSDVILI